MKKKTDNSSSSLKSKSLCALIYGFRNNNKQYSEEILWTINYLDKLTNDWEVYFAIDYHLIYEYAFQNFSDYQKRYQNTITKWMNM